MPEKEVSPEVDLSTVLGYIATKDLTTTEQKIIVLGNLGYSNKQMAKICATNEDVIKTLKSKAKKGGAHGRRNKSKPARNKR